MFTFTTSDGDSRDPFNAVSLTIVGDEQATNIFDMVDTAPVNAYQRRLVLARYLNITRYRDFFNFHLSTVLLEIQSMNSLIIEPQLKPYRQNELINGALYFSFFLSFFFSVFLSFFSFFLSLMGIFVKQTQNAMIENRSALSFLTQNVL